MNTKKITGLTLYFFISMTLLHAQNAIDKYYSQYSEDPEFTSVVISSKMFELFAKIDVDDPENKDVVKAMSDLNGIKILTFESDEDASNKVDYQNAINKIGNEYEMLMSIDEKEENVRFFIREEGDTVRELLMMVGAEKNFFVMSISGNIDLEKLSSLSKSMNVGGMNYLQNLDDKDKNKKNE